MKVLPKSVINTTAYLILLIIHNTSFGALPNPSFEVGEVGEKPEGWTWFGQDSTYPPQIVKDAFHGEKAIKIPVRDKEYGDATSGIKPSNHLPAGNQKFYKFGFYYKSKDLKSIRIRMRMYDASNTGISYVDSLFGITDTNTWTYGELDIKTSKPQTVYISPQFAGVGVRGWERLHMYHDYDFKTDHSSMNKVYDISEFTNHGNYLGDATISEGKYGLGLRLDGQGDAVVVSHDDSLSLKEEFTIAAWIAPEKSANVARQTILGKKKQL